MLTRYLLKNTQLIFCIVFFVYGCQDCQAQDYGEPMVDTFSSGGGAPMYQAPMYQLPMYQPPLFQPVPVYIPRPAPMPYPGSIQKFQPYQDSLSTDDEPDPAPTPDGTEDASKDTGDFANTLPKDPHALVGIIKGLLQEHPPMSAAMSPLNWETCRWRGRIFVSLEKLSFLTRPCYLAWYHTTVAYEKFLTSGNPADNNEFKKMYAMAERVCNGENDNSPASSRLTRTPSNPSSSPSLSSVPSPSSAPSRSPSENNKMSAAPSPGDNYSSSSPAPPPAAPHLASAEANKMPPVAPKRRDISLPPVAQDSYNFSARDPQALPGTQSTSPDGPSIIQGEAGKSFAKPSQALKSWAGSVWAESKKQAVEFAGKLYQNWDGTWSYTPSYRGKEGSSQPQLGDPYVFTHGQFWKSYEIHTHGDYRTRVPHPDGSYSFRDYKANERRSVDEFSPIDIDRSVRDGYPQFILTPGGVVKEFIPDPIKRLGSGYFGEVGHPITLGNLNSSAWREPENL